MPVKNETLRASTGKFDTVLDDFAGGGGASPGLAPGQVGAYVDLDNAEALLVSSAPSTYPLFEGRYQYVKLAGTLATAPARGLLAFYSDRANHVVTTLDTNVDELMGVFLGTLASATNKYCIVQRLDGGGRATVSTAGDPTAHSLMIAAGNGTAQAAVYAAQTGVLAKVGIAEDVEDSNDLVIVDLTTNQIELK